MKKLTVLLLFITQLCYGQVINLSPDSVLFGNGIFTAGSGSGLEYYPADYFVATDGDDNDPGTYEQPFATWQKGFETATAGDLVYIRGGVYTPTDPVSRFASDSCGVYIFNQGGTVNDTIKVFAYPGETPILDLNAWSYSASQRGIYFEESTAADYWYLKGLTVRNVSQQNGQGFSVGLFIQGGDNYVIEECTFHDIGGTGVRSSDRDANHSINHTFINCDSYDNYDPYSSPGGGNADGFQNHSSNVGTINYYGCRAWDNSDDGYDFWNSDAVITVEKCWSFDNGYDAGDGGGFKMSGNSHTKVPGTWQRVIKNNMALYNEDIGFYENTADINMKIYNNLSVFNGQDEGSSHQTGYNFSTSVGDTASLVNNIGYGNFRGNFYGNATAFDTTNSWNPGISAVTNLDFTTIDTTGIRGARGSDGSLPVLDLYKIVSGSDLADVGTDVGISYNQSAPDLGPYESDYTAPSIDVTHYADATALFTAMDVAPSESRKDSINAIIQNLVDEDDWATVEFMFVPACHSNTGDTEEIDWKNSGNTFTYNDEGNMVFTKDLGVAATTDDDEANTNFNPTTDAAYMSQNSATYGTWLTEDEHASTVYDFGFSGATDIRFTADAVANYRVTWDINTNGVYAASPNNSVPYTDRMFLMTRIASDDASLYYHGAWIADYSNASSGVPDGDILFCGWNGPSDGTRRVALFFAMDGVNDIEQEEIFNIFNKWKWW